MNWYGVRSLYRTTTHTEIEERITMWRATTEREALLKALGEAHGYWDTSFQSLVGVIDAHLFTAPEAPGDPWIVFRAEISSTKSKRKFVRKFAETGKELQSMLFRSAIWDPDIAFPETADAHRVPDEPCVYGVRLYVRRRDRAGYTEITAVIMAHGRHEAVSRVRESLVDRIDGGTILPVAQTYCQSRQERLMEGTECFSIVRETNQKPEKFARKRYPNEFFGPNADDQSSVEHVPQWFEAQTTFRDREDGETLTRSVSWEASSAEDATTMAMGEAIAFASPWYEVVGVPDVSPIPGGADTELIQGGTTYFKAENREGGVIG